MLHWVTQWGTKVLVLGLAEILCPGSEDQWFTLWSCSKDRHRHILSPLPTDKTGLSAGHCYFSISEAGFPSASPWNGLSLTQKVRAWGKLGRPTHSRTFLPLQGHSGCARHRACRDQLHTGMTRRVWLPKVSGRLAGIFIFGLEE